MCTSLDRIFGYDVELKGLDSCRLQGGHLRGIPRRCQHAVTSAVKLFGKGCSHAAIGAAGDEDGERHELAIGGGFSECLGSSEDGEDGQGIND